MAPQAELNRSAAIDGAVNRARVLEPADESEVMREQLEYLIIHTAGHGLCGCSECQRYVRVRALLLEIFSEPAPQAAAATATLPMAA